MQNVGSLTSRGGAGTAINNIGHMTGFGWVSGTFDFESRAFFWKRDHNAGFGTLNGQASNGASINDSDQITGMLEFPV